MTITCSHVPQPGAVGTGYAKLADGTRVCYECADAIQREDISTAQHFTAYIGEPQTQRRGLPGSAITTWTGGRLGIVVASSGPHFTPTGGEYFTVDATCQGVRFHGRTPGHGMYVNLHRAADQQD